MKQVAIIGAIVVIVGAVVFAVIGNNDDSDKSNNQSSQSSNNTDTASANPNDPNNYTDGANIGETVDATGKAEVQINVDDFIFKTTFLKISKGTKVTWTNQGKIRHSVKSAPDSPEGGLESGLLTNGQTYDFTFDKAGLYEYFCEPHPTQMRAVITVVE